ncbi:MAG: xanthine dehydrogenase family protein molybdopterin-binding subunit, partial [Acidobacteria bacterium]|nr:xanthine dehydrogenase family protein molybdopterin-binding subunit [Acidobacteriota bacterium]
MTLSRRAFIQRLSFGSAGLTIGLQLQASSFAPADATEFTPDVFVTLEASGTVRIRCHRSEMGQGIRSTIPRLIADEMEADWNKVVVEQALGDAKYGDQNTDGSRSIRKNYDRLKRAGATVRTLLQQAAADTWQVAPDQVRIHNHAAHHADGKKTLGFGALVAKAANLPVPAADQLTLKPEKDYRYVMKKEWELLDGLDIVTGKAEYGYDVAVKDMKIALIARPPVVFGKVKSFDASETLKVPGVLEVVEMPALSPPAAFKMLGGIAVVAEHTWAAIQGREKLKIEWEDGPNAKYDTVAHQAEFEKALEDPKHVVRQHGNWQEAESQAESRLDAAYKVAGLAHATMEPLAATARLTDDGVEVWACTQTPQAAQANVMQTLEIPQEKANSVKVHVTLLGGGFGRKSKPDYVAEAAFLAHKTKRT